MASASNAAIRLLECGSKMPFPPIEEIRENGIHVLFNPKAGSHAGDIIKDTLYRFGTDHINYHIPSSKQDFKKMISWLAAEAEKRQTYIMIIIVGGDGTYHDTVNATGNLGRLILGLTDGGSSSDYTRTLGIKKYHRMCNLVNALIDNEVSLEERVKLADMIKISYNLGDEEKSINGLNLFSIGFDGEVCKKTNSSAIQGGIKKKLGYIPASIQVLRNYVPLDIEYIINGEPDSKDVAKNVLSFVLINGQYAASGMQYNPYGRVDDEKLECVIAQYSSKKNEKKDLPKSAFQMLKPAFQVVRLAFHIKVLKDNKIVDSLPGESGYNKYGVKYLDGIKSMELKIINPEVGKESYFESDGEHYQYEPTHPLQIEVMPKAIHVLHVPAS